MSGFNALAGQAVGLLLAVAVLGVAVGWFFGSMRGTRVTTDRYDTQLRATLRRMSESESDAVTLRAQLAESEGVVSSQLREHESREHLLAALEARLAEAEGAATAARRMDESMSSSLDDQIAKPKSKKRAAPPRLKSVPNITEPEPSTPADQPSIADVASRTGGDEELVEDDLTRIKGIGKVIATLLGELGFTSFRQIARLTEDEIDLVDNALGSFRGRIRRDDWMSSASQLHKKTHGDDA